MSNTAEIIFAARDRASGVMQRVTNSANRLAGGLFSVKTSVVGLVTGYASKKVASGFMETAESMDMMKMSLDTLTKGHGAAWFEKLNDWAFKMPANTQKAIDSFKLMRAMGLKPTIRDMTILIDTTSAIGGQADTLEGISRALGQIKTKGKASAEELMQLAERGIPAYEILQQKLNLTAEQVANIGNEGIRGEVAVRALLEGMAERFGGMSSRIMNKMTGLKESVRSYYTEWKRLVMESGPMHVLESLLRRVVDRLNKLRASGDMEAYAKRVGVRVVEVIADVVEAVGWLPTAFFSAYEAVAKVTAGVVALAQAATAIGAVSVALIDVDSEKEKIAELEKQIAEFQRRIAQSEENKTNWRGKMLGADVYQAEIDRYRHQIAVLQAEVVELAAKDAASLSMFERLTTLHETLDEIGTGLYQSGEKAGQSAQKFAVYGVELEKIAARIRSMKTGMDEANDSAPFRSWAEDARTLAKAVRAAKNKVKEYADYQLKIMAHDGSALGDDMWLKRNRGMEDANERLVQMQERTSSRMIDLSRRTADAMENNFSSGYFDIITGKLRNLHDVAEMVFRSMARIASDYLGQITRQALFGQGGTDSGYAGGLLSSIGGLFSSGGGGLSASQMALQTGAGYSMDGGGYLGEDVFGFGKSSGRSYEFHKNEIIGPPQKFFGGGQTVIQVINNGAQITRKETSAADGRRFVQLIVDVVADDIREGGRIAQEGVQNVVRNIRDRGAIYGVGGRYF